MKTKPVVITTQPEQQADRLMIPLEEAGISIYNLPAIHIEYPRPSAKQKCIFQQLDRFHLLIFTSRNGVTGFFRMLEALTGDHRLPEHIKIAAIGASSAREVKQHLHSVHFAGSGISSEEFAESLKEEVIRQGDQLLLALSNLAPRKLQESLQGMASVERMDVYETVMPEWVDPDILQRAKNQEADLTVFTSPSAFRNFIGITEIRPEAFSMPVATIGKTTGDSITSMGYRVDLVARRSNYAAFAEEIINYLYTNT